STRWPMQKNVARTPSFARISAIRVVYSGWGPSSKVRATAGRSPGPRHRTGPNSVARGWKSPHPSPTPARPSAPAVAAASGVMPRERARLRPPGGEAVEDTGRFARAEEMPRGEDDAGQPRRGMKRDSRRARLVLQDARLGAEGSAFHARDGGCGRSERHEDV